jgi:hypothetical protein
MAKAKTKKTTKAKAAGRKKPTGPAGPRKVIVRKKDLENALANMAIWCSTLREALEAYDGKKDRAILYVPGPYYVIHPPNEILDCKHILLGDPFPPGPPSNL